MVEIGSGAKRAVDTVRLDRYACYLIVQNSDPSKAVVALGQTYFAIQTRRQEMTDRAIEDKKRIHLRDEIKKHNVSLAEAAGNAGVENHGRFQNYGYKGLYGGMDANDIHESKRLKKSQKILDHMGSEELAANLFRATQTDAKLRREAVKGEANANAAHFDVGRKVRQTIEELGGTMPEDLPCPDGIGRAINRMENAGNGKERTGKKRLAMNEAERKHTVIEGGNIILILPDDATKDIIRKLSSFVRSCPEGPAKVFLHLQGTRIMTPFSITADEAIMEAIDKLITA